MSGTVYNEDYIEARVRRELRVRGVRRVMTKTGAALGLVAGLAVGAALPRQADYVEALRAEAKVHETAATTIAAQYPHRLSKIFGREEQAFLDDAAVPDTSKRTYLEQRRMTTDLETEAKAVMEGKASYAISAFTHLGIAGKAVYDGMGKADLTSAQTYKSAAVGGIIGGLAGGLLLYGASRRLTRRK